ncbi:MAG: methyltransferase domain-containing protein [Actinobacteria bacterium]|nr:methyltransferase domain-containing protein [Actinomycetota bacterium]
MAESAEPAYQHRVLESLASAQNYIAWLASLARPHLGDDLLEVGAGAGDYAAAWLASGGLERITLTEMDPPPGRAAEPIRGHERVDVLELDLRQAPEGSHSAVVAFNVLEHIEDDVGALRSAQEARPPRRRDRDARSRIRIRDEPLRPRHRSPPALHEGDARRCLPRSGYRPRAARVRERTGAARMDRRDEMVQA